MVKVRKIMSRDIGWHDNPETYTVDILYLECPLFRTSIISNFFFGPSALSVTALINSSGVSDPAISNFHYIELFSPSVQRFLWGCFPSAISRVFISLIRMLKKYLRKFSSNVYLFLFQHSNMLVKQMLNVKSSDEKCQALKFLESGLSNKEAAKKYVVPKNTISAWTENKTYSVH